MLLDLLPLLFFHLDLVLLVKLLCLYTSLLKSHIKAFNFLLKSKLMELTVSLVELFQTCLNIPEICQLSFGPHQE